MAGLSGIQCTCSITCGDSKCFLYVFLSTAGRYPKEGKSQHIRRESKCIYDRSFDFYSAFFPPKIQSYEFPGEKVFFLSYLLLCVSVSYKSRHTAQSVNDGRKIATFFLRHQSYVTFVRLCSPFRTFCLGKTFNISCDFHKRKNIFHNKNRNLK